MSSHTPRRRSFRAIFSKGLSSLREFLDQGQSERKPAQVRFRPRVTELEDRLVPAPVVANNDTLTATTGVPTLLPVLANDSDPSGATPIIVSTSAVNPAGPTIDFFDNGLHFTSAVPGTFSFNYTITGGLNEVPAGSTLGQVAISGNTALVAAPATATQAGSVYVFVLSGTTWVQQAILTDNDAGTDGASADSFGSSVAIDGGTAVIGRDLKNGKTGAAYVFVRSGTSWTQQAELVASDGAAGDIFGNAVSVSGDTVAVGASGHAGRGAAYVFVRSGTNWSQQAELTSSDGTTGDQFGNAVSLSGDAVIVGAVGKSSGNGAAYIFSRNGANWTQQAELGGGIGGSPSEFGFSVSVDRDTAVVGAPSQDGYSASAFAYVRSGTTWSQQGQLIPGPELTSEIDFGYSVSVSGDIAVIGANGRGDPGQAEVFTRTGTTWSLTQQVAASVPGNSDSSVALSGETVLFNGFDSASHAAAYFHDIRVATAAATVQVTDPLVTITSTASPLTYGVAQPPLAVDFSIAVSAVSLTLSSATVQIAGGFAANQDVLGFNAQNGIIGSYDAGTGVLTLSGVASVAQYQAALQSITFFTSSGAAAFRYVYFTASDGTNISPTLNQTIWVISPSVITLTSSPLVYAANQGLLAIDPDLSLDPRLVGRVTVQITGNYNPLTDTLYYPFGGTFDPSTGTLTIVNDPPRYLDPELLADTSFSSTSPAPGSRTVTFIVNNGIVDSAPASRTILIVPSVAPSITTTGTPLIYDENRPALAVDPELTIAPGSFHTLTNATAQITGNYVPGQDLLSFSGETGISASFDPASGTLSLSGDASPSVFQAALQEVAFSSSSGGPDRTITFIVSDGAVASNAATRKIVVGVAPPALTATPSTLTYTGSSPALAIDTGLTVAAGSFNTLASATVQITSNYDLGKDILGFASQNGITGSFSTANGTLTLTGNASAANYQAALQSVTIFSTAAAPGSRVVTFVVSDGLTNSIPATRGITVVDAPPAITTSGPIAYIDSQMAISIDPTLILKTGSLGTLTGATVQITGNYFAGSDVLAFTNQNGITRSFNSATGLLTLSGSASVATYQAALRSVTFASTSDSSTLASKLASYFSPRTVTFVATDGTLASTPATDAVVVEPSLDVDGNGTVDPLTDGVLILRFLFGFSGSTLTSGAFGVGATRTSAAAITSYLSAALPQHYALDPTFGSGGTDFAPGFYGGIQGAVLQPDGKILTVGTSTSFNGHGYSLMRYNPDGTLDTTFGNDGVVIPDDTMTLRGAPGKAVALQPDGDIVVVGGTVQAGIWRPHAITPTVQSIQRLETMAR